MQSISVNKRYKKVIIYRFLLIAFLSMLTSGCSLLQLWQKPQWTVMVWMAADNNLSNEAIEDIQEMEHGLYLGRKEDRFFNSKINIVAQVDTNAKQTSTSPYNSGARIMVHPDNNLGGSLESEVLEDIPEPNMGSAEELKDFIQYTKANYPAERYALIIWDHGDGVRSVNSGSVDMSSRAAAIDEHDVLTPDTYDMLYTGEISEVLGDAEDVDFLGYDACLMGFIETAYEYRPRSGAFGAEAVAFSPAEEQGDGWEYHILLENLAKESLETVNGQDFAKEVVQAYREAWSSYENEETMTAVDNTKIETLKTAVDELAAALTDSSNLSTLKTIQDYPNSSNVLTYFNNSNYGWRFHSGFDLYDLASEIAASSNFSSTARGAAESVKSKTDAAVLHSWGGDIFTDQGFQAGKNGLSLFFPAGYAEYNSYTFWDYQYFYTSNDHTDLRDWYSDTFSGDPDDMEGYGGIDFCDGDGDETVETWFEMLQYWFNP